MVDPSTPRLLLRPWRPRDRAPFADLNADPEVMRHFPAPLDRSGSDALADRIASGLQDRGWGLWAVEVRESGEFVGFTGLQPVPEEVRAVVRGRPGVEVGWRLVRRAWGRGYATEAARAAVAHAFDVVGVAEVVSFTAVANARSRAVMERLGMTHDASDDFDHPRVPRGSTLRRHVLYRLAGPTRPAEEEDADAVRRDPSR